MDSKLYYTPCKKYNYILSIMQPNKKYTLRELDGVVYSNLKQYNMYYFNLHQSTLTNMRRIGLIEGEQNKKLKCFEYWKEEDEE